MRTDHPVLHTPLEVPHRKGLLKVLEKREEDQTRMGEALTLECIVNSCDAEVIAKGASDKGPERGAIVRHGRYTLWGYGGGIREMTDAGKALFINTLYYAARQAGAALLEKRRNKNRDELYTYLDLARHKSPGFLKTMAQYLPEDTASRTAEEIEAWIQENRAYFIPDGRRLVPDPFARSLGIPNHKRAFLEACMELLERNGKAEDASRALERYTGRKLGMDAAKWRAWYQENRDFLYFSDCDGFRFLVDLEAKDIGVPFETLRGWSSESLDYRVRPGAARLKPEDAAWYRTEMDGLLEAEDLLAISVFEEAMLYMALTEEYRAMETGLAGPYRKAMAISNDQEGLLRLLGSGFELDRMMAAFFLTVRNRLGRDFIYESMIDPRRAAESVRGSSR